MALLGVGSCDLLTRAQVREWLQVGRAEADSIMARVPPRLVADRQGHRGRRWLVSDLLAYLPREGEQALVQEQKPKRARRGRAAP